MKIGSFAEIEDEFVARAHKMVWCALATVDARGRPRTRVLHPIWEGGAGWIATRRHSPKARDLAHAPYVSLAYIADLAAPAYVDGIATWVDDLDQKRRIWEAFKAAPPPLGYDPAPIFIAPDDPGFGLLRITPQSVRLYDPEHGYRIWHGS